MDYPKIYNNLVSHRKTNPLKQSDVLYTERHHIVPRCLGGADSKENLIRLTGREHFIAHWLLVKLYPENEKLKTALFLMCHSKKYKGKKVGSKLFEKLRANDASQKRRENLTVEKLRQVIELGKSMKGRKFSELSKQKMSDSSKKANLSKETLLKMSVNSSKTWLITDPFGNQITFKGPLKTFCILNDISHEMMHNSSKRGGMICVETAYTKRTQIALDTTGWGCKKL